MLCTIIYKNYLLNIKKYSYENDSEFEMRKWYILKNLFLTYEYGHDEAHKKIHIDELINYSKIHVKKEIYNCTYDQKIMKMNDMLEKNLYI